MSFESISGYFGKKEARQKYNLAWKTLTHIQTKCDLQKLVFYIQNEQHLEHKQFQ